MRNKFSAWVDKVGGTAIAARRLGFSVSAVRKYAAGERKPRPDRAELIETYTMGQVPRESWYWYR